MKRHRWFHYVTPKGWIAVVVFPPLAIYFWWILRGQARLMNKIYFGD